MTSKQIMAYGGTVEQSVDGVTWVEIPECKGLAVPTVESEFLEATSLDSPGRAREYVKGMTDGGTISLSAGYTSAGYAQQIAAQARDEPTYYRTTMAPAFDQATGDVFQFRGWPTPQVEANDVGALVGMTIAIRVTGAITWTAGTAEA
jgi:hypothetical protein